MEKYPANILRLLNIKGFRDAIHEVQSEKKCSSAKAFEIVNDNYFNHFDHYRYSDYGSYKVVLTRWSKRERIRKHGKLN